MQKKLDEICFLIYNIVGIRTAIIDLRKPDAPYSINKQKPLKLNGCIYKLPLVEGEYSLGIFFACTKVCNNFMDLRTITVVGKNRSSLIPYPANVRGLVELEYDFREG